MTLHAVKVAAGPEGLLGALKAPAATWEERMAQRAAQRPSDGVPIVMHADVPEDFDDTKPRRWCTTCGLPDPPDDRQNHYQPKPPCPRCGSTWTWFGRAADLLGTATEPAVHENPCCFEWRRFTSGQRHFGWSWWVTCNIQGNSPSRGPRCDHEHHSREIWIA